MLVSNWFFVYGSLKPGYFNNKKYLENYNLKYYSAEIDGKLYSLANKDYPAVIEGNDKVKGYLFECDEKKIIDDLDSLEKYNKLDSSKSEYNRLILDVYNVELKVNCKANVYLYNNVNNDYNKLGDLIEFDGNDWS